MPIRIMAVSTPATLIRFAQIGARKDADPPLQAMHRPLANPRLSGNQLIAVYVEGV